MFVTSVVYFILMSVVVSKSLHPLSDEFIDHINKQGKWRAGRNFHPDTPMEDIKHLAGTRVNFLEYKRLAVKKHDPEDIKDLPESFDPREKWPNCNSLNEIRDQGRCGSCWAFAAVEPMTDRVCTYSNGTKNFHFSAEDLVTCSDEGHGCFGGSAVGPWEEWVSEGIVSGGNYGSHKGCLPYSVPTCADHMKKCTKYLATKPCERSCIDGNEEDYKKNKKRGKSVYEIDGEDDLKAELFKNGPVSATFLVYEDLASYKSGVYQHLEGEPLGGHAVKMLGWGVEDGKKYWLLANSWGTDFGENGFFKMLRGENECYIEMLAVAGDPMIDFKNLCWFIFLLSR